MATAQMIIETYKTKISHLDIILFNIKNKQKNIYKINSNTTIINYDFKNKHNWRKCLKLLQSTDGKKLLDYAVKEHIKNDISCILEDSNIRATRKNIASFMKEHKATQQYSRLIFDKAKLPYCYCRNTDDDDIIIYDGVNELLEKFELREKYESEDEYDEEYVEKRMITNNAIVSKIYELCEKNMFISYVITHSCFTYGAIVSLYLARNIEPNENWGIIYNNYHAVVVNNFDNKKLTPTKVFDILLYEANETDFGGTRAYLFATDKEHYESKYNEKCNNL